MSLMKTYKRYNLNFVEGNGVFLIEKNGEKYLDFVAGVAVNALGHSNSELVNVIKNQASKLIHISNLYYDDNQLSLANKLVNLSGFSSVFFTNSGTESIEGALKIAKKYGKNKGKDKIIYMNQSFHGRTLGALSVTGQVKYQKDFTPLIDAVIPVNFNDIEDLQNKMNNEISAVIVEPIQGEGGINEISNEFLNEIRSLCDFYDSLLIFDEVQAGVGRTGKFFAFENYNIKPDIIAMAKGLGGGVPIGALIANKKADILTYSDHGCTFGGNPLVTAVGNKVVDIVSDKDFLNQVTIKGNYLIKQLNNLMIEFDFIKKIKGKGLMIGVEIDTDKIDIKDIIETAITNKLLIIGAGSNTIRLVPPLNVTIKEIDLFIKLFEKTLKSCS
ncbi:aspartate aminotransferase family protein [Clostridiaceae bacterium HSG29]|nr:aspartate aminotransferase family protein [Clostridiaceae bacterium HSG29]